MTIVRLKQQAVGFLLAGACASAVAFGQAKPGDDFYRFANAQWEAAAVIPDGAASWGMRAQLRDDNLKKMIALYQAAGQRPWARKVADYHAAQLDQATIEQLGLAPIQPMLAEIGALQDKAALARYLGRHLHTGPDPLTFGAFDAQDLFGLYVGPGLADPSHHMPYLLQGGLGLLSSAAYRPENPVLAAYRRYIGAMLHDAGIGDADSRAQQIIELESTIASKHTPPEVSANLAKAGTVWRRADFKARAKGIDWDAYFDAAGIPAQQAIGAWQPEAIAGIAALVDSEPLEAWQDYLRFHLINNNARFLPKALSDRYFAFFDPIFIGPNLHRPLWDHVISQTNSVVPNAGRLFAEHHFSKESKANAEGMVQRIVAAFDRRLDQLDWMTAATRSQARAKLKAMVISVGHPQAWIDSSSLLIKPGDVVGNVQRTDAFKTNLHKAKIGKPVERQDWIPNAELFGINIMPSLNAMTIPMVDLQAPQFDPQASDAANYGTLGVRIARSIGLALSEQGSRFDAQGRLRPSWTNEDKASYQRVAASLAAQFPGASPRAIDNGVADLTSLAVAYDALRMARQGAPDKLADQRFFTAYAESLRLKSKGPAAVGGALAPAHERAAMVRNLDAWYAAFDVMPGQALYLAPQDRVKIW